MPINPRPSDLCGMCIKDNYKTYQQKECFCGCHKMQIYDGYHEYLQISPIEVQVKEETSGKWQIGNA